MICFASLAVTSGIAVQPTERQRELPAHSCFQERADAGRVNARVLNVVGDGRDNKPEVAFDLDQALAETVSLGASDLHVKPGCRPRVRVEGELKELNGYGAVTRDDL